MVDTGKRIILAKDYKLFSCSTYIRIKLILIIKFKMQTRKLPQLIVFKLYEDNKFHAQHEKSFIAW